MRVDVDEKALKDLKKIDKLYAKKIFNSFYDLENYPNVSNIKKLTNFFPPFRYRVGNYRVLFNVENNYIKVYRVLHRRESYKQG